MPEVPSGYDDAVTPIPRGRILYTPSASRAANSRLTDYARFLQQTREVDGSEYVALHRFSVENPEAFWRSIAEYFAVDFALQGDGPILTQEEMPGAHWFPGWELNYAAHALRTASGVAIIYRDERGARVELDFAELRERVARCRTGLARCGVGRGDTVVAYLGNCPEAVIAFLATASLGAIWSSCPPEFGVESVLDRFQQIEPKVLIATDAYDYAGRRHVRGTEVARIRAGLPTLNKTVLLARNGGGEGDLAFDELLSAVDAELVFEPVPFEHPLWILYSSGTTGKPKAIVHGHGGILLEHYKVLALHSDLSEADRFFWYSTTGWMMWNYLVSGLLLGATIVLYEGSPTHPDSMALWKLIELERITYFGTSAPFIHACRAQGIEPRASVDVSSLLAIGSTGAPLSVEGFEWVYESVKSDIHLGSVSGGTDVCTAFLLSNPWWPVRAGELQCAALGVNVQAFDETGSAVFGRVGELVITKPLPSMPVCFWNDPRGERFRQSYFEGFEGVWCHGDWVCAFDDGSFVIFGRSDATLNRGGVRMGTSEFYSAIADIEGLSDALVVDTSALDGSGKLWLFVVLAADAPGTAPDDVNPELVKRVRERLKERLSPRHVPDVICAVREVPYTLSGKKLEVPVKRLLSGARIEDVAKLGTLRNPQALTELLERARQHES